ncbi:MAG: class I SAM-dependent methyltransferase [Candidatus Thorarchaeota archaeon]
MADRISEQWENNAQAFADLVAGEGTPHHKMILNPCVENLVGTVKGKRVLDAGCGEGYLTRHYASKGADVTGVDISKNLIEIARDKSPEDLLLDYKVDDICHMDSIADNSFDIVLCNLVILNVPCFKEAFSEFNRVLVPGGILVISIVHPAFNFYGPGSWEMGDKDPETRRRKGLFFKMDDYFDEKYYQRFWKTRKGEKFPEEITFFHRTLSTYMNAVLSAGFQVTKVEEPLPVDGDGFFERENRIPFFIVIKATKN